MQPILTVTPLRYCPVESIQSSPFRKGRHWRGSQYRLAIPLVGGQGNSEMAIRPN